MQCTYGAQITFDKKMWKTSFKALGLPQGVWKTILGDIFGVQVGTHFEGLVDSANAAAFNANLASLEMNWNNLETGANPALKPEFQFLVYRVQRTQGGWVAWVLPEVRKKAQIHVSGHPLQLYRTNRSESINHMIKHSRSRVERE